MKEKIKVSILLGAEFVAVIVILLLIFLAGKKTYTVTFDLNGGTLLGGDLEQRVTQGHDANPPQAVKEGHYFLRWSGSYKKVTHDVTVKAIWEYETTPGIVYSDSENANFCEIVGSYSDLRGDVYIGAYYNDKKVLGIKESAFAERTGITAMYLLDGIIHIEKNAFFGCENMTSIDIPSTTVSIGEGAFAGCASLEELILPESLTEIGAGAFADCVSLREIVIPDGVKKIGAGAFAGCTALERVILPEGVEIIGTGAFDTATTVICVCMSESDKPATWSSRWCHESAEIVWDYVIPDPSDEKTEDEGSKDKEKA